jgi:hypothetical protein
MRDVVSVKLFVPPGCSMQEASCEDRRIQRCEELRGQAAIEDAPTEGGSRRPAWGWLGGRLLAATCVREFKLDEVPGRLCEAFLEAPRLLEAMCIRER